MASDFPCGPNELYVTRQIDSAQLLKARANLVKALKQARAKGDGARCAHLRSLRTQADRLVNQLRLSQGPHLQSEQDLLMAIRTFCDTASEACMP